ncbi:hypothetical protein HNQ50_001996 [Silvimonas terrae]|uniref:Beta-ketoacyl synthase-like N-terminal domain-containing protein n=1 Tax=Silvimonas terrae TaxID=300266 RepID=A0A840RG42_9NEIS|nr:beta-ketoacyl synthase chain length factor [Silvimonas terrae]MBB5191273.1 hypothetical protein [Silvimonas terrae]
MDSLRFSLESWAAWAPDLVTPDAWQNWAAQPASSRAAAGADPAVAAMPPMLRRRAQRLGRMALEVLYSQQPDAAAPIVFASRFGEIGQATALLRELAHSHTVSPQAFSMSVHNAVAGLYTIARKEPASVMALAAGTRTAQAGLFEAAMQLADGAPRVRLLFCDEPLPEAYQCFGEVVEPAYALMLTLVPGADYTLAWQPGHTASHNASPLDVLRFVLAGASAALPLDRAGWALQRIAA